MRNRHPSWHGNNNERNRNQQQRGRRRHDHDYHTDNARFAAEDNGPEAFAAQYGRRGDEYQYQEKRPADYEQRVARDHMRHAEQAGRYADPLWWGAAEGWRGRRVEENLGTYAPHAAHGTHSGYGRHDTAGLHSPYGRQSSYGPQDDYSGTTLPALIGQKLHRPRTGPKGYVRSDERIREDVCERLADCHDLDVSEVSVDVETGKVILQGNVPERWMKHLIEDVTDHCPGVKEIDNRVRVSGSQQ